MGVCPSRVLQTRGPVARPSQAPAAAPAAAKAASSSAIVGNKDSKIFHRSDCKGVGKMKETNKTSFASAADAAKAGFKPCKTCKP